MKDQRLWDLASPEGDKTVIFLGEASEEKMKAFKDYLEMIYNNGEYFVYYPTGTVVAKGKLNG